MACAACGPQMVSSIRHSAAAQSRVTTRGCLRSVSGRAGNALMLSTRAEGTSHVREIPDKPLNIDIPVNLMDVKEVFGIASLSFEGDLPGSLHHSL